MQNTETVKAFIRKEIEVTEDSMKKIHDKMGGAFLCGSIRAIESVANQYNQQWPRLELLRILLTQETIPDEALELINQGTLTQAELEAFLAILNGDI